MRLAVAAMMGCLLTSLAVACPYCTVESQTLTEEIAASDAVVLARLIKPAVPLTEGPNALGEFGVVDPETGRAKFEIEEILLGDNLLEGVEQIEAVFFGEPDDTKQYFIRGVGMGTVAGDLDWNIPMPLTDAAVDYIHQLDGLPEAGPKRLEHFLQYLQHEDPLLAQDTYDEFARAPYADLIALADQIDRPQLWQWIEDRDVSPSRRSLFFTMLGVCGKDDDIARLRKMMLADQRVLRSAAEAAAAASLGLGGAITLPVTPEMVSMEQRRKQLGFNALVGCYLKLSGSDGLDVIDEYFLADPDADPTKVYGALIALRFLGEETDDVPMERLLESMRLVLGKPDFAEQAITDLARWEDWSVLDRLVTMFENAPPRTYVKEPIVAYLDQASRQAGSVGERANTALEKIEQLDPDTVKRARSLLAFGFLGRARGKAEKGGEPKLTSDDDALADGGQPELTLDSQFPEPDEDSSGEVQVGPDPGGDFDLSEGESQIVDSAAPSGEATTAEPVAQLAADANIQPQLAEPPQPPISKPMLLGLPVFIGVGIMGLIWLVLRGGA